jgi:hypothetical protein
MWEKTGYLNAKTNLNYGNIKMRSYLVVNTFCTAPIPRLTCLGIQGLLLSWASHIVATSTVPWGPRQLY